ncbi:MAG: NYN domain-containing protein [Anaerolineae bacterium]|nr:NYN domain-containing protein [Anaerolineae bacterium]
MASYLFVDVDSLLAQLRQRGLSVDLYDLAGDLRRSAALAAGLSAPTDLNAIAVANWGRQEAIYAGSISPKQAFEASGFERCAVADRRDLAQIIWQMYLADDDAVDELIVVTNDATIIGFLEQVKLSPGGRIRLWAESNVFKAATATLPQSIFQPLEAILGYQGSLVAVYIDFENIAISLDKQGYIVNLEHLIARFVSQAQAHGQVVKLAAYAPWGQRGSLPPLVDNVGREITDNAPSRLAMANIDPVFNLPGKNSADMRIARDIMADLMHPESADIFILASGDRDFNEIINSLRAHNKQVIVWAVRGSISRQVETNPAVILEFIEDFANLQPHELLGQLYGPTQQQEDKVALVDVRPSQWVSTILQYDNVQYETPARYGPGIPRPDLEDQLVSVNAVVSPDRAANLVTQALAMDLFRASPDGEQIMVNDAHPLVEQTRLVRDRIVSRVANTLDVRGWEYVNYGFLLKGIAMDRELDRPGLNINDQWRSEWIDCLVREGILHRELVPHRHNPEDLVPVIKLSNRTMRRLEGPEDEQEDHSFLYKHVDEDQLTAMQQRIVVSVEQFTSFRGFMWCPLGSLHRRLRPHDPGMVFQQAIENLLEKDAVEVKEYENPQSEFRTKGISLVTTSPVVQQIMMERDTFVQALLKLYDRHEAISQVTLNEETHLPADEMALWLSIMQDENILNPIPGRSGQYSLFRTHHTVVSVANDV